MIGVALSRPPLIDPSPHRRPQTSIGPNVRFGSKAHIATIPRDVRFTSNSGHCRPHSITSSARPISVFGMLRPSAFAVFRLIYSSTLVACWTGRSAGLSPLRTRPV